MANVIRLTPSGVDFKANEQSTILEAALINNINLEYSCSNGKCGQCKATILDGEIDILSSRVEQVREHKLAEDVILTCCSIAKTGLTIEAEFYPELNDIEIKTIPAKVSNINYIGDLLVLTLRLPPAAKFKFLSGQFIDLMWNGIKRSYSIASSSVVNNTIEFHIKKVNGGVFSEYLFNELKVNQLFRINGPLGSFFLRDTSSPVIFLCTGSGFAPIKSMVEKTIEMKLDREIYIYWGGRVSEDLYSELPYRWSQSNPNVYYHPVLSREDRALFRKGYVQSAVVSDHNDLSGFEVYACGSKGMIEDAKELLVQYGLNQKDFYSDAFVQSN